MGKGKWLLIVLVMVIGLGGWKGIDYLKKPPVQSTRAIPAVFTQPVKKVDKQVSLVFSGSVQAREESLVSGKVTGKVINIAVKDGDLIKSNGLMIQLDTADYQTALQASRGVLIKAEAGLASARASFTRAEALQASGALARKELEDAENALKSAQGDYEMASAEVAGALTSLADTSITAPISGVVADRSVALGQIVSPGIPLMTVLDISSVYISVNADQKQLGKLVKVGAPAVVTVDGFTKPFRGKVDTINPSATSAARVFEVKILVPNPDLSLKPGMYARVVLTDQARQQVLAVPQNALISQEGLYYVYLYDGGKVKRQPVKIGDVIGSMVEIRSGLKAGQNITISNINKLKDGDQVRARPQKRGE